MPPLNKKIDIEDKFDEVNFLDASNKFRDILLWQMHLIIFKKQYFDRAKVTIIIGTYRYGKCI